MSLSSDPTMCVSRARRSLDGLSVGDAFGQRFFGPSAASLLRITHHARPEAPWAWTDDTHMALSITEELEARGSIDPGLLASAFARRYVQDPHRGYGGMAHEILTEIARGADWAVVARAAFGGQGSCGNGAAMRVAPVGAYFAYDMERVRREALRSAEPTHAHPEGAAGAVAVACAAATATLMGEGDIPLAAESFFRAILPWVPAGETRTGIERAAEIDLGSEVQSVVDELGSGQRVMAQDTVPFSLWCAARSLDDFAQAMWTTVEGLGDRDTTCAIVGGIVAMSATCPSDWVAAREALGLSRISGG